MNSCEFIIPAVGLILALSYMIWLVRRVIRDAENRAKLNHDEMVRHARKHPPEQYHLAADIIEHPERRN